MGLPGSKDPKGDLVKTRLLKKEKQDREAGIEYMVIKRTYRKNVSCEDLHQIVTFVEESANVVNQALAILQYRFASVIEKNFEVLSHGNKKDKSVPYLPVNKTTREAIKSVLEVINLQKL